MILDFLDLNYIIILYYQLLKSYFQFDDNEFSNWKEYITLIFLCYLIEQWYKYTLFIDITFIDQNLDSIKTEEEQILKFLQLVNIWKSGNEGLIQLMEQKLQHFQDEFYKKKKTRLSLFVKRFLITKRLSHLAQNQNLRNSISIQKDMNIFKLLQFFIIQDNTNKLTIQRQLFQLEFMLIHSNLKIEALKKFIEIYMEACLNENIKVKFYFFFLKREFSIYFHKIHQQNQHNTNTNIQKYIQAEKLQQELLLRLEAFLYEAIVTLKALSFKLDYQSINKKVININVLYQKICSFIQEHQASIQNNRVLLVLLKDYFEKIIPDEEKLNLVFKLQEELQLYKEFSKMQNLDSKMFKISNQYYFIIFKHIQGCNKIVSMQQKLICKLQYDQLAMQIEDLNILMAWFNKNYFQNYQEECFKDNKKFEDMLFSKKKEDFFLESRKGIIFLAQGQIKLSPKFQERPQFFVIFKLLREISSYGGLLFCNLDTDVFYGINKNLAKLWRLSKKDFKLIMKKIDLSKLILTKKEDMEEKLFQNKTIDLQFDIGYIQDMLRDKVHNKQKNKIKIFHFLVNLVKTITLDDKTIHILEIQSLKHNQQSLQRIDVSNSSMSNYSIEKFEKQSISKEHYQQRLKQLFINSALTILCILIIIFLILINNFYSQKYTSDYKLTLDIILLITQTHQYFLKTINEMFLYIEMESPYKMKSLKVYAQPYLDDSDIQAKIIKTLEYVYQLEKISTLEYNTDLQKNTIYTAEDIQNNLTLDFQTKISVDYDGMDYELYSFINFSNFLAICSQFLVYPSKVLQEKILILENSEMNQISDFYFQLIMDFSSKQQIYFENQKKTFFLFNFLCLGILLVISFILKIYRIYVLNISLKNIKNIFCMQTHEFAIPLQNLQNFYIKCKDILNSSILNIKSKKQIDNNNILNLINENINENIANEKDFESHKVDSHIQLKLNEQLYLKKINKQINMNILYKMKFLIVIFFSIILVFFLIMFQYNILFNNSELFKQKLVQHNYNFSKIFHILKNKQRNYFFEKEQLQIDKEEIRQIIIAINELYNDGYSLNNDSKILFSSDYNICSVVTKESIKNFCQKFYSEKSYLNFIIGCVNQLQNFQQDYTYLEMQLNIIQIEIAFSNILQTEQFFQVIIEKYIEDILYSLQIYLQLSFAFLIVFFIIDQFFFILFWKKQIKDTKVLNDLIEHLGEKGEN